MRHFDYHHLPEHLQRVSRPICDVAQILNDALPECAEKSTGLRKLLEAKDCMVRASIETSNSTTRKDTK